VTTFPAPIQVSLAAPDRDGLTPRQRAVLRSVVNQGRLPVALTAVEPHQWMLPADFGHDREPVDESDIVALVAHGYLAIDVAAARLLAWAPDKGRVLINAEREGRL
jgi:hypothetical protein